MRVCVCVREREREREGGRETIFFFGSYEVRLNQYIL